MRLHRLISLMLAATLAFGCERDTPGAPEAERPAAESGNSTTKPPVPPSDAGEPTLDPNDAAVEPEPAALPDPADDVPVDQQPTAIGEATELDVLRSIPYAGATRVEEDERKNGVIVHDRTQAYPGYNMYTMRDLSRAVLIDMDGKEVNSWAFEDNRFWERAVLLENGDVLVVGSEHCETPPPRIADDARYIARLNWSGDVVWKTKLEVHHDAEVTPQGDILVLGFKRRLIPQIHEEIKTREDYVYQLSQSGEVTGQVPIFETLVSRPDLYRIQRVGANTLGIEPWIDLFHLNAVERMRHTALFGTHPLYHPDHVLICSRHQDAVFIINWISGELVWAWGHGKLSGPHDAQLQPDGNITIFDNGMIRNWSRVIELDPRTNQIVWEYKHPKKRRFFTRGGGAAQRLPNGNTLIAESAKGHAFEVTPYHDVVWRFRCPYDKGPDTRASIVRMIRYETGMVERIIREHGVAAQ